MAKYTSKTALELTGSDIRGMTRNELANAVSVIASAANKRIVRLEQAGQPIQDTWKKFSVAGKSRAELMREFSRVKNFMTGETTSLSGQASVRRKVAEQLAKSSLEQKPGESERKYQQRLNKKTKELNTFLKDKKKYDKFWRAYEMLKEKSPQVANKQYKYKILQEQKQFMIANPRARKTTILKNMEKAFKDLYKAEQKEQTEDDGDAFTL